MEDARPRRAGAACREVRGRGGGSTAEGAAGAGSKGQCRSPQGVSTRVRGGLWEASGQRSVQQGTGTTLARHLPGAWTGLGGVVTIRGCGSSTASAVLPVAWPACGKSCLASLRQAADFVADLAWGRVSGVLTGVGGSASVTGGSRGEGGTSVLVVLWGRGGSRGGSLNGSLRVGPAGRTVTRGLAHRTGMRDFKGPAAGL